jgi:hypothetical protein
MLAPHMAAGAMTGILTVNDVLTLPHETVRIEARLSGNMPSGGTGWAGISLQLAIDGKPVATAKTNGNGEAIFDYRPSMRGINVITVSVVKTEPVEAEKAEATLCVWERRRPILLIELEALMQLDTLPSTVSPAANEMESMLTMQAVTDAAEELSLLTQYYYNVVYVPTGGRMSASAASAGARRWLRAHKFPAGFVMPVLSEDLHAAIERFKRAGWTTMKSGVGRSRSFADTLLRARMEVVVVPELPKSELPRKAKMAKDWKEVRKKL